jgi:phenylpyruvate tautomerase PptA (4-oxalocrotonate tautomerase family)
MPIVILKTIVKLDDKSVQKMLSSGQDAGARALGSENSNIWVRYEYVPENSYLQDADRIYDSPIVLIMANRGRSQTAKTAFVQAVAQEVALGLAVPADKVWVHYQEMDPKDIWHNGRWTQQP